MEVVHLRPFIEGMIVALRALKSGAEEDTNRIRHVVERHAPVPEIVTCRAILPIGTSCSDQFINKLVVGHVIAQGFFDPELIGVFRRSTQALIDPQQVCPEMKVVRNKSFAVEQFGDQSLALVLVGAGVKGLRLFDGRDTSAEGQPGSA